MNSIRNEIVFVYGYNETNIEINKNTQRKRKRIIKQTRSGAEQTETMAH